VNAAVQTLEIPRNNQRYTMVHGVAVVPTCSMESAGGAPTGERRLKMPEVIQIPKTLPMELRVRVVENYARRNNLRVFGNIPQWNWSEDILLSQSKLEGSLTGYVGASDGVWFIDDKDYYRGDYQKYLASTWVEPKKFLTDRRVNHAVP